MTLLITGGAGYIGSHAVVEFIKSNYDVIVVDDLSNSCFKTIRRVEGLIGKSLKFYNLNLLNYEGLEKIFSSHNITSVIHFAGYKAVAESVENPLKYYKNNIMSTINLCEVMNKYNVKQLVFSSSATVYGNAEKMPITEEHSLEATNPYGRSKLMIEQLLTDIALSDTGWKIAVLRYFNPIGAHESGQIGENPNGKPNNLMPYITQVAVGERTRLQVFGNDYSTYDGTGVRDYIHVVDLVHGHIKALEYLKIKSGVEFFNLGTGKGSSVLELIETFSKVSNRKVPYEFVDRRAGDVAKCYADTTKANDILGWEAKKNLQDMCKDSWNWQNKNPTGY